MFYKIDNSYYVLVGNKYMQVEFKVDGEEINAIPTGKELERNGDLKVESQEFDESFKRTLTQKKSPTQDENKEHSRFGRER